MKQPLWLTLREISNGGFSQDGSETAQSSETRGHNWHDCIGTATAGLH